MKIVAGTSSTNPAGWGWKTKGFSGSPSGKVPHDFSNEELTEGKGLSDTVIKTGALMTKRNNINKGKGYSLMKGIHYALENGYTHGITLDADLQHDPACIPEFLSIDENISIVCGKRDLKGSMPCHRRLSYIITSKIVSFICHTKLYDSQCGYRRYKLNDVCSETYMENGFQNFLFQ